LRGVERELPANQETYGRFSALEDGLKPFASPEPAYADTVSADTLTGLLEQSEGAVDTAVIDGNTVADRELTDPGATAADLGDVNELLFDEHAPQGGVDPYRYDPFLVVDAHDTYLSYTAIVVGAENHLSGVRTGNWCSRPASSRTVVRSTHPTIRMSNRSWRR